MTTTTKTSCPSPSTATPPCSSAPLTATRHLSQTQNPQNPSQDLPEKDDKELLNVVLEAHHGYAPCDLIDNTQLVYVPLKLPRTKVRVMVRPEVLVQCPEVLGILDDDVAQCCKVLPKSVHRLVRRTRLWVNHTYVYGPKATPIRMNHTTTHHHQAWLERVGDRGDKALGIEIYNCWDFMRMRLHWNGCGLLLHELCHLLHQMCLGLDHELVWQCYRQAQHGGKYQCTLRRDWAVYRNDQQHGDAETDQHYCMVDQKEFFAEMSVTFLASGYTRWDHCRCYNMQRGMWNPVVRVSPPLMEPSVVARVYGGQPMVTPPNRTIQSLYEQCVPLIERPRPPQHCFTTRRTQPRPHCNKFYPFTRGQFRHYDPQLFCVFEQIWNEGMAKWKDPEPADDNEEEQMPDDCCFVSWGRLCPPKWWPWRRQPKVSAMVGW